MDRRTFLGGAAMAGAAVLATGTACSPPAPAPAPSPQSGDDTFELDEATIDGLQEAMRSGRLMCSAAPSQPC